MADRFCKNCKLSVSEDLANCPLCGKYLLEENDEVHETKFSFPVYDGAIASKEKLLKTVRNLMLIAGLICIIVNLIFTTSPYWFFYPVVSLFCVYMGIIHPFRRNRDFIIRMQFSCFYIMALLIFIDAYTSICFNKSFGWGYALAAPLVYTFVSIVAFILSCTKYKFNMVLAKQSIYVAVLSIIYFAIKVTLFSNLILWPSLVFLCVACGNFILLMFIRAKGVKQEMEKEWHI
ncbi:MAG: hypothetical protein IJT25_01560 [Clostridia bacterium]|nr:hypothetical protein [Clostridia bacterium]